MNKYLNFHIFQPLREYPRSEEGLDKAIALHGFVLHGRALLVGYAQKKKEPGQ